MSPIKVRNPAGVEFSFRSREEFSGELVRGGINADWEIYHSRTSRWLSVAVHPAFQAHAGQDDQQERSEPSPVESAGQESAAGALARQPRLAEPFSLMLGQRPHDAWVGLRGLILGA
jgi:hypothetical protein